jgi:hypothetical protein
MLELYEETSEVRQRGVERSDGTAARERVRERIRALRSLGKI